MTEKSQKRQIPRKQICCLNVRCKNHAQPYDYDYCLPRGHWGWVIVPRRKRDPRTTIAQRQDLASTPASDAVDRSHP